MNIKHKDKKTILESLSYLLAGFAFIVGLLSIFMPFITGKKIPIESLYWFFFALIAILFPYIKEITFKDLKIALNNIKDAKKSMDDAKISLEQAKEMIDPTRVELIQGYQKYLSNLPEKEKMQKVCLLSSLYLRGMNLTIEDVKSMLKDIGYYKGKLDNEFSDDYYQALYNFQKDTCLNPDGIFGYQTYRNLINKKMEEKPL